MVVVEGVARSLNPQTNIWHDAKPIVESYIKDNVGPKALLRDLQKTALVLARFGPKLPRLVEAQLVRQSRPDVAEPEGFRLHPAIWMIIGAGLALGGVVLGQTF